ncbi:MAG: protein-disulfide reductase DsbD family protein [Sphingobium phenoxybenzoativorans]
MRIFHFLLMTMAALLLAPVQAVAQLPGAAGADHIAARLVAESDAPAPGSRVTLAFVMEPEPGWHGYWENPGDAGLGMTVKWTLPSGVTAGVLRYPVPETLLISGLMNHVYEGRYAILTTLDIPASLKPGTKLPLRVRGDWLACTDQICVPAGADLTLDLTVGDGAISPKMRATFDSYRAHLPRPLGSQARFAVANGKFRLAIPFPATAQISQPWFFALTDGALKYATPQRVTRNGDMLIVESDAAETAPAEVKGVLRTGDHVGLSIDARPGAVPAAGTPVGGAQGQTGGNGGLSTILLAFGGAILGGLILNIMPCVFPILSLKALSLAKAGGDAAGVKREAWAYAAGVIATCLALGAGLLALRAGGAAVGWAFQLQDPRVILLLLVLVTAIALNLAGLFELRVIGAGQGLAGKHGVAGAFWTGVLVAFVATPCTGPFMGAALGAALVLPVLAALAIFAGLGIGLALPFLLIALMPAIRAHMPKPGAWMGAFQRWLSIPMFVTALALAWLLGRQVGVGGMTIGLGAALATGLLLWLVGLRQHAGRSTAIVALVLAALILVGGMILLPPAGSASAAASSSTARIPFDEVRLLQLRGEGKPVFLYFTADWCLTCKANEAAAIDRTEVAEAFSKAGVTMMVGDWTNADPAIGRFLESHGRSGVPLYLWYAPGKDAQALPQVLTPATLTALVHG